MLQPIQGPLPAGGAEGQSAVRTNATDQSGFYQTLRGAMGEVEKLQVDGQQKIAELLRGNGEDIHETLIAVEKADLSFELMMQVRNKIVQAYQEISRMPF